MFREGVFPKAAREATDMTPFGTAAPHRRFLTLPQSEAKTYSFSAVITWDTPSEGRWHGSGAPGSPVVKCPVCKCTLEAFPLAFPIVLALERRPAS